jgi:ATP-binding cassette, subfamily B, multidrug efflux pump
LQSLKRLNKYFFRYKGRFVTGVLFVIISNVFGIIPAKLIRYAIDEADEQITWYRVIRGFASESELVSSISMNLFLFAILVLFMALLKGLFMFFMRQTIIVASRHIEYDIKNEVYSHYQDLDATFYSKNSTGDLMNRISEDVSRVRMYIGPAVMYTVNLAVMFILVIYAMLQVNPALTFFTLLPLPVLSLIIYYVEHIINRKSEAVQSQLSVLSTFVQESFSGIRVLKAYAREEHVSSKWTELAGDYRKVSMDLVKVNALFHPSLVLLIGLSTILTIFIGGIKVMEGEVTIGNIAEFVIYINMLTWPVAALGYVVSLIQRADASQRRINEFLDTKPAIRSDNPDPFKLQGDIEFRNVSYRYPVSGVEAVRSVSFRIPRGGSVGIIGRTGSGKSTIAHLLLRFIDPDKGQIFIDGQDLRQINLRDYRRQSGYVPQDVFLFSDTLGNNIAMGFKEPLSGEAAEETIRKAAAGAEVLKSIESFPKGLETRIGERGITLSGGQKQRVSIARALVRNPVLLVFDDCLSAVDTITEERILKNLREVMAGKSTLIISHRISSVRNADTILVLDRGMIAEQGTHQELLALNGIYADIVEKQELESRSPTREKM